MVLISAFGYTTAADSMRSRRRKSEAIYQNCNPAWSDESFCLGMPQVAQDIHTFPVTRGLCRGRCTPFPRHDLACRRLKLRCLSHLKDSKYASCCQTFLLRLLGRKRTPQHAGNRRLGCVFVLIYHRFYLSLKVFQDLPVSFIHVNDFLHLSAVS